MRPGYKKIIRIWTAIFSPYIFICIDVMSTVTNKKQTVLTSVKVDQDRFNDFKVECVRDKFTLTQLVNKCMDLYLNDEDFRKAILNYKEG